MWSDEGISTMKLIDQQGYIIVNNFFTAEQLNKFANDLDSSRKKRYKDCNVPDTEDNKFAFNDGMITKSYSEYSPVFTDNILIAIHPKIEQHLDLQLYPVCGYARIYYKHSSMYRHKDREACEYSITFPIKQDDGPWDIWLKNKDNIDVEVKLELGDILIYKGCELPHWRFPLEGNEHYQIMLHYVNANGPFKHRKYDNKEERFYKG